MMKFGMKALQTFRSKRETTDSLSGKLTNSVSGRINPNFFIQLLGIPLVAYVLTQIANQVKRDARPLDWAKIQADLLFEKLQKSGLVFSEQYSEALTNQQIEAAAHFKEQSLMMDMGNWVHFNLFLGAILVVYSFDLIMDMIVWDEKGVKLKSPVLILSLLLFVIGVAELSWQWLVQLFFNRSVEFSVSFGYQSLWHWVAYDWGLVLVILVVAYGFMAWKRIPFMAMVSPFVIAFSIALLLMMPIDGGFWWLGDANKDLDSVQRYRTLGIFLYLVGCFLLNVLLVQRLEKSKDWDSESPNVWLLFAVDFKSLKLKYHSEEPELASFPRFWWVPYFWLFVSAILVILGLYFMIQGDDLLEKQLGAYKGLHSPDFYFERYAFRAMLLGFFYGLLRLLQTFIQWNRIYRLLVELGLLILVL